MSRILRAALGVAACFSALSLGARTAAAQASSEPQLRCDDSSGDYGDDRDGRYCEIRDTTFAASRAISVDARQNGGVRVYAWSGSGIRMVTRIQARAGSDGAAKALAQGVSVRVRDGVIESDGPRTGRRENWSVSYELYVPKQTDLEVRGMNGGIAVRDVEGRMNLHTMNGGISLTNVAGDVHGETTNGGVVARLDGATWRGAGLDLETTNGGVRLTMPDDYSARLEAATVNGSFDFDFPVTLQGRISKSISTIVGKGGPLLRVRTTNGGVAVRKG